MKNFRPTTPSQRHSILSTFEPLSRGKAAVEVPKHLRYRKPRTSGRNHSGHITIRHRGGAAHKRLVRVIDFRRDKDGIAAHVAAISYDPHRSAFLALLHYADGEKRYIIAPQGVKVGDKLLSGEGAPFENGCAMQIKHIPVGMFIHNIELVPGRGGKLVRSAGLSAQLMARSGGYATVKMPSGEIRLIKEECRATLGSVSNPEHNLRVEGKAGRERWRGIRPTVRGTAMNPVDHPHGGGEGKHNGYLPQTPWAMYTKGYRTRNKRKPLKWIVKDRRK